MTINQELYRDLYKNARMLVILKLILDLGGCATAADMAKLLGVHRDGVSENVYHLADRNMVARPHIRSGWFITKLGMEFLKPSPQLMPEKPALLPENPALAVNTTTTLNIERTSESEVEVVVINGLVPEKPALLPEKPALADENTPVAEDKNHVIEFDVWRAFTEIGITRNPTSEKAANTPGLTYDGVLQAWSQLISLGKPWRGLLLQILPSLTPRELRGHSEYCRCSDCRSDHNELPGERISRNRYSDWDSSKDPEPAEIAAKPSTHKTNRTRRKHAKEPN